MKKIKNIRLFKMNRLTLAVSRPRYTYAQNVYSKQMKSSVVQASPTSLQPIRKVSNQRATSK